MQKTSTVRHVSLDPQDAVSDSPNRQALRLRFTVTALVFLLFVVCYSLFRDRLSIAQLAAYESTFRTFYDQHPVLTYGIAFAAYVAVAGLSLPGAAAMTLLMGWLFGLWRGILLVSFASTAGASIAFVLSRYLLRESIQSRFGPRLARFNQALIRDGAFYLFTLRLIPAVPFFVINVVMGLTPVRLRTFWCVSQLGMLPGTSVYVYAGSNVPSLQELADTGVGGILSPKVLVSFALLGLFPLVMKRLMAWWRPASTAATTDAAVVSPAAKSELVGSASSSLSPLNCHRLNGAHVRPDP